MIWRVALAAFLTATLSLFAFNAPHAQFNGCPAGFCSPPAIGGAPAAYTGPGDVISGWFAWYGLRAYSAAYATANGKLINVLLTTNSHTCDILTNAATGGFGNTANCSTGGDNGQSASSFCGSNCTVVTAYDQSGGNNCSSAACDATQDNTGKQPALVFNCLNTSLPCMSVVSANDPSLISPTPTTTNMPASIAAVVNRTAAAGSGNVYLEFSAGATGGAYFTSSANTAAAVNNPNIISGTASDNSFHAIQIVNNASSSSITSDGSGIASGTLATQTMNKLMVLGSSLGAGWAFNGKMAE